MQTDNIKSVLTVAGSDSVGGAGIQADIKTIFSLGLYACSAITAVTAQNTCGVRAVQAVDSNVLYGQIAAVLQDISVDAVKIGMVYTKQNVRAIKNALKDNNYNNYIVLDPVLVATSGDSLAKEDFLEALKQDLFPLCDILTPNLSEAMTICNRKINNVDDMIACGKDIIKTYGVKNVLVKGGHSQDDNMTDVLVFEDLSYKTFTAKKINSRNTHGTGCTLSSAIASYLAMGLSIEQSVKHAKDYVYNAILSAKDHTIGQGHGSTNHFYNLTHIHPV
ncbi:MAG: bifunctional hydroxymethylpyrimidine kinase/phosphomethylpyrimidine kinase [Bacteroidales bacterium]|nr:bifunctional hydroxymethylpyrimidine kinase/phosphomethylpyrimidine kinase [Bacteroidales bacterium]